MRLNTKTGFAAIPNDFLQNPSISIEAKGTAAFLQSLPDEWKVQAWYVQRELGYGERVWQKVAKELKECGYLTYITGGKIGEKKGGSYYEFSIWKYETKLTEPESDKMSGPINIGNDKMSAPTNIGARKMSSHIKKLTSNKETNNENNNKQGAVVVPLHEIEIKAQKYNIKLDVINRYRKQYGDNYVIEKIDLLEETLRKGKLIEDYTAWLISALRDDWKPSQPAKKADPKVTYEETQKILEKRKEDYRKAQSPESRSLGLKTLSSLTRRAHVSI